MLQGEGRGGEAYDSGVAETQAALKAQVPGVCRLYYSQVWNEALKQAGVEASFDLWKAERVYYPFIIKEDALSNSEARDVPEEIEAADPDAALAITSSKEPAKESDPSGAAETDEGQNPDAALAITSSKEPAKESDPSGAAEMDEGQNPDAPQETIGSTSDTPVSLAEGPVLLVEPLQSVPLEEGSKDLETSPAQISEAGVEIGSKE